MLYISSGSCVGWLGGLLVLTTFLKISPEATEGKTEIGLGAKKAWFGYIVPGMAMVIGSGLYQFVFNRGIPYYMKQGWFHGKLTFGVVLIIATIVLGLQLKRFRATGTVNLGALKAVQIIGSVSLVCMVLLTLIGQGI